VNLELEAGLVVEFLEFDRLACRQFYDPQHNLCGEGSDCDRLHVEIVLGPVRNCHRSDSVERSYSTSSAFRDSMSFYGALARINIIFVT